MQRAILILILFVALMSGRHPILRMPQRPETMVLTATPLALDSGDPKRRQLGALRYLGGWSLAADRPSFGGISSLRIGDDGAVTALGDGGEIMTFRAGQDGRSRAHLRLVPMMVQEKGASRSLWDTESMTTDPVSGRIWVGFEYRNRICRYSAGFGRVERCRAPEAIRDWPNRTGMESLARLPDGRFLAIAEESPGPGGVGHDMLLFAGDPVDAATPPPIRMAYVAPQGYLPTDAVWLGHGRLLVMNRRVTLAEGFTGVLTLVDMGEPGPGRLLRGTVVARLAAPVPHDNFEGLAIGSEGGERVLWIASDDNHLFFQRSLLLKFAMPAAWFTDVRGGGAGRGPKYRRDPRFFRKL